MVMSAWSFSESIFGLHFLAREADGAVTEMMAAAALSWSEKRMMCGGEEGHTGGRVSADEQGYQQTTTMKR